MRENSDREPNRDEYYKELSYFIYRYETIRVLNSKKIVNFFPIQYQTFDAINFGQDLIGRDRTGSGKTIAYSLPVLERLRDKRMFDQKGICRFLVLVPTRQLANQVHKEIDSLKLYRQQYKAVCLYGGVKLWQHKELLKWGYDIVVGTVGRVKDLIFNQNCLDLRNIEAVCLDQADQMLEIGFKDDVELIMDSIKRKDGRKYQVLLFSATMPQWVQQISNRYMARDRNIVDLIKDSENKTSTTVQHLALECSYHNIVDTIRMLVETYLDQTGSFIIFCERKIQVNELSYRLHLKQSQSFRVLHGDIPQPNRQSTFEMFKSGKIKGIIATNVAARGLDIPSVDLIIQIQPPDKPDDYIHRAGRTGRAGKTGKCVTLFNSKQIHLMEKIEREANIMFTNLQHSISFCN